MSAPVIQALGMVSPLGALIQGCAALRAGISRRSPSPYLTCAVEGESRPQPLVSCEAFIATLGFSNLGRLVALVSEALKDLGTRVDLSQLPADTLLFMALPDPLERAMPVGPELEEDEPRRYQVLGRRVMERALKGLGLRWTGGAWRFFGGGNAAFAQALGAAVDAVAQRHCQACLVIAVDSLAGPDVLPELLEARRLKKGDRPTGFIPGEGAVALLLTSRGQVSAPGGPEPRIVIRAVELGEDSRFRGAELPPDGRVLSGCVASALRAAGVEGQRLALIGDLNGEEYRAREWGMLLVQLRTLGLGEAVTSWFPTEGFGETGAASGALGLCAAVRGLQRRYSPSPTPLVVSISDGGERAAILVSAES
jgi:3-oxoacyl-[acyl-carrier-protein] synthase-1